MPKPSKKTKTEHQPHKHEIAVAVRDVTVRYDGPAVVEHISFSIPIGHVAAIIGPNGSGKTTLIKALLGLIPYEEGEIIIFGKELYEVRSLIGYVPQRFDFDKQFPITVGEFLSLALHRNQNTQQVIKKLKEVGLEASIFQKQIGTLSGGQLQRVLIAQATLHNPSLLILDEPATGIDIVGEQAFVKILKNLNKRYHTTILIVSHDVSMVSRLVDIVICINKKLMCAGPPKSTLTQRKLEHLYGGAAHIHEHDHV